MEVMSERMQGAQRALGKLHELAVRGSIDEIERDALIKRFEIAFELLWKCGKDYLLKEEGLDVASPKKVIRAFREVGLFSDEECERALSMAGDRNLTAHVYDEDFSIEFAGRVVAYEGLMQTWWRRMAAKGT